MEKAYFILVYGAISINNGIRQYLHETKMVNLLENITNSEGMFKMSKYVDGFVLVVPNGKEDDYEEMAKMGRDSWMKHGALEYFECRGDDLKQQEMGDLKSRAFAEMAGASADENVWFSFIVFESKKHRDEVNKKVMEEMSQQAEGQEDFQMPADMQRMAYGGFEVAVEG